MLTGQDLDLTRAGFAAVSGAAFTLIGFAYRMGKGRGIRPIQILGVVCLFGAIFFGIKSSAAGWGSPPLRLYLLGLMAGLGQYFVVKLIRLGLDRGGLSAVWCALSLGFLVPAVYGVLWLDELLTALQYFGIACGVGCVVVASWQGGQHQQKQLKAISSSPFFLGLILLGILLLNGLLPLSIKEVSSSAAETKIDHLSHFFFLLNVVIGGAILIDQIAVRAWRSVSRDLLWLGPMAAVGSVVGLTFLSMACTLPAAVVFTVNGISGICTVAVISALAFGEKVDLRWVSTIGLGLVCVALLNLNT